MNWTRSIMSASFDYGPTLRQAQGAALRSGYLFKVSV